MTKKTLTVILNGTPRKRKMFYKGYYEPLSQKYTLTVLETQFHEHAIQLAKEAALQHPFGILAAGGDGTLNQVVNGLMPLGTKEIRLGIVPLGTGNDFARLCGINSVETLIEKIEKGGKPTDVGLVTGVNDKGDTRSRFFINVASLGLGPVVVKRLLGGSRALGPTLTYFKAIAEAFFIHSPEQVSVQTERWQWVGKIRALAIANGKSFGSALFIAPDAIPDDGLLSTFIAGNMSVLKFLFFLQWIKMKKKINDPQARYNTCSVIELNSPQFCLIETDGELACALPAKIEVLPRVIDFFR